MPETPIEWVISPDGSRGHTINPIRFRNLETGKIGHHCTKVSPGCAKCYSSAMQSPYLSGLTFLAENTPKGEYFLDQPALNQVLKRRKPTAFFWCDMTDLFGSWVPDEWIDACVAVMQRTPQHRHMVLTKRSERMRQYWSAFRRSPVLDGFITRGGVCHDDSAPGWPIFNPGSWPPANVWLGVSVENQEYANGRIPDLLATPAVLRFVSYEPALGPVDFTRINHTAHLRRDLVEFARWHAEREGRDPEIEAAAAARVTDEGLPDGEKPWINVLTGASFDGWDDCEAGPALDWIIVGGESGPNSRPFDLAWPRSTVTQCAAASVACFVKQMGANPWVNTANHYGPGVDAHPYNVRYQLDDRKGGNPKEWPADLRVRQMPEPRA